VEDQLFEQKGLLQSLQEVLNQCGESARQKMTISAKMPDL
jgi:hypothetical protein